MASNGIGDLNARFTDAMVLDFRQRWAAGAITQAEIAQLQNVGQRTVRDMLNGRTYAHLNTVSPPPLPVRLTAGHPKVHDEAALTPRVRELRARQLTNRQIGALLGLDQGTVSRLHNHGRVRPK